MFVLRVDRLGSFKFRFACLMAVTAQACFRVYVYCVLGRGFSVYFSLLV